MVDGVLLLVDAFEGPMPQTKFVLRKSLELHLKPILVVNKMDRPQARPHDVVDMTFDLFCELNATDEQLDFPIVFASAKEGTATFDPEDDAQDMKTAVRDHDSSRVTSGRRPGIAFSNVGDHVGL